MLQLHYPTVTKTILERQYPGKPTLKVAFGNGNGAIFENSSKLRASLFVTSRWPRSSGQTNYQVHHPPWLSLTFRAEKRSAQAFAHPLSQAQGGLVDCVCLLLEFWVKCTRCERLLPVKHFYLKCLLFSSLKNYFGFGTTNVKGKPDHSVNLRWNKRFWTFLKRRVFFWLCIRLIYELISPGWIKTRLYSVISNYGYFQFTCPDLLPLQNQLYLCLQWKNHIAVLTQQSHKPLCAY